MNMCITVIVGKLNGIVSFPPVSWCYPGCRIVYPVIAWIVQSYQCDMIPCCKCVAYKAPRGPGAATEIATEVIVVGGFAMG